MTNSIKRDLAPPPRPQPRDKDLIWGNGCRRCGWLSDLKEHTSDNKKERKVYFLCDYCEKKFSR